MRSHASKDSANPKSRSGTPVKSAGGTAGDRSATREPRSLERSLNVSADAARPMEGNVRRSCERGFGHSLADVRIVSDGQSAALADRLNARAFTYGNTIWFGRNEYRPHSFQGRELLAHELSHTLQQRETPTLARKPLQMGTRNDPAEAQADRAARAFMLNRPMPAHARGVPILRRRERGDTCTVSPASPRNFYTVLCGAQRYRVQVYWVERTQPATQFDVNLGRDGAEIRLDVSICRGGTRVNIRPSTGDLSPAVRALVTNLVRGGGALAGVQLSPELEIAIAHSGSWQVTFRGRVTADLGTGQVTGGRGSVEVDTEHGSIGVYGEGQRGTGGMPATGTGGIIFRPGDRRPEQIRCEREQRKLMMRCQRITTTPGVPAQPAVTRRDTQRTFLMYPYNNATPEGARIQLPGGGFSASNVPLTDFAAHMAQLASEGFRVVSITGHASPEGSRAPSPRRRFGGNIALAQNRAEAAQTWLTQESPESGAATVTPRGESELFSPGTTPETEGAPLARHATGTFLGSDDPLAGTEEERQRLGRQSLRRQRDAVYPRLRRAEIILSRTVVVTPARAAVPERTEYDPVACPQNVANAVRDHLGIQPGWLTLPTP